MIAVVLLAVILLAVCATVSWLAVCRPAVWLGLCLTATTLPAVATRSWSAALGPASTVPPATWLMLVGGVALLLDERRVVQRGTWPLLGTAAGVAVLSTLAVWSMHGQSSANALVLLWILPMAGLVAVLAASTAPSVADVWAAATPWVSVLAVSESLLAIAQRMAGNGLVFEEFRSAANSFSRTGRSAGTFDTPLDLAVFLTLALVVVVRGGGAWWTWTATLVVVAAIVCTGSRTGMVLAVGIVGLGIAVRGARRLVDLVFTIGATVGAALLVSSARAAPLFARFGAQGDRSSWARDLARHTGFQLVEERPVTGSGLTYAYEYALANLPSSFENAWLSLAIGAGLPVALLVVAIPVIGWLLPGPTALLTRAAGAVPLVWGASYSAYTATNTFGVLAWTFLGLAAATLLRDRDRTDALPTEPDSTMLASSRSSTRMSGAVLAER